MTPTDSDMNKREQGRDRAVDALLRTRLGEHDPQLAGQVMARLRSLGTETDKRPVEGNSQRLPDFGFRRVVIPLAAAAVLLVVAGMWWLAGRSPKSAAGNQAVAHVTEMRGGGQALSLKGDVVRLAVGNVICEGDTVATLAGASAQLRLLDQSTVVLREKTRLTMDKLTIKRTYLTEGIIDCHVTKQAAGESLVFVTPQAEARVIGTDLTLGVEKDSTTLKVASGNVLLTRLMDGASVNVAAGQYATVGPGVELVVHDTNEGQKPQEVKRVAEPKETVVYLRKFETIPHEWSDNELVRLEETNGEVSAMMSLPYPYKTSTWKPDGVIGWCRVASDVPEDKVLYTIPENVEIRMRIKSEKPGKFTFCQGPGQPQFEEENFYADGLDVTNEWREVVVRANDIKPYIDDKKGESREFTTGVDIAHIGIYGYGTGKLYLARFEVLSVSKQ